MCHNHGPPPAASAEPLSGPAVLAHVERSPWHHGRLADLKPVRDGRGRHQSSGRHQQQPYVCDGLGYQDFQLEAPDLDLVANIARSLALQAAGLAASLPSRPARWSWCTTRCSRRRAAPAEPFAMRNSNHFLR